MLVILTRDVVVLNKEAGSVDVSNVPMGIKSVLIKDVLLAVITDPVANLVRLVFS